MLITGFRCPRWKISSRLRCSRPAKPFKRSPAVIKIPCMACETRINFNFPNINNSLYNAVRHVPDTSNLQLGLRAPDSELRYLRHPRNEWQLLSTASPLGLIRIHSSIAFNSQSRPVATQLAYANPRVIRRLVVRSPRELSTVREANPYSLFLASGRVLRGNGSAATWVQH